MQPRALQRAYELRSGEEILGDLRWNTQSGSLAEAEAGDGHWTFKRTGFFHPQITIRTQQSDSNIAAFIPNWNAEGALEFCDGKCYQWKGTGFWRSQWAFTSSRGEHLVDFEPHSSFLKQTAAVKVTPAGFQIPELSLLVLLGWYLLILRAEDDAASAAVICMAA